MPAVLALSASFRRLRPLWLIASLCLLLGGTTCAQAQVKASLIAAHTTVATGQSTTLALRLQHEPHWHTYWQNPGTGLATQITWTLPAGLSAGPILWPAPLLLRDTTGAVSGYGYENDVLLPVRLTVAGNTPAGPVRITAKVAWLMCQESCVPGEAELNLDLTIGGAAVPSEWAERIQTTLAGLPVTPGDLIATANRSGPTVTLTARSALLPRAEGAIFFSEDGLIAHDQPHAVRRNADGALVFTLPLADTAAPAARLAGVITLPGAPPLRVEVPLASSGSSTVPAPPRPDAGAKATPAAALPTAAPPASTTSLFTTLLLALAGGLILNLMPCVFPVLGIKVLGFVQQAGSERAKVIQHGLVFTLGVVLSFWALAGALALLRAGGTQLGWGFQLQSPAFVFCLAVVMLVFALNLSGVFEFGLGATAVGGTLQMRGGFAGSFFTGVLATVVATPCSAPFLAPALGVALTLSVVESFAVFTAIALGLSAPYLALSLFPAAVKWLPRPGAWMEGFKQFMAFPLYATVAYLIWVLAGQVNETHLLSLLLALVLVALAVWSYGRATAPGAKPGRARLGLVTAALAAGAGLFLGWPKDPAPSDPVWEPWSEARVAELRAQGRTVYVDFTARWCATCQANKRVVFGSPDVLRRLAERRVVLLKADWTNRDPLITRELARLGRSAVPVNLVYRPDRTEPELLPELLTPGIVLAALP